MADKDNEFLDEHGDAFSPDEEDEFAIPENAFDDDEELSEYADEFGDNFADDIAIQEDADSSVSDDDLAIEAEEPILQDDQVVGEQDDYSAHHSEEVLDDYEDEAPVKQGVGWKAWTGVIILGLATAGGLAYFVMPDSSPNRSVTQSQQLPTPPQQSQEALPQPPQQPAQQQAQQRPAVDVQAFPQQNQQPPLNVNQGGSNGPSLSGEQVAGSEPAPRSNQLQSELTGTNYSRNETQAQQGSQMPVNQGAGQNFEAGGSNVIRGNATSGEPMGDRPGYISEIENQLAQFSSIARIAQQNAELITDNREDLAEFKTLTNAEIEEIKARLDALESGETPTANRQEAPADKADNAPAKLESGEDGFTYNIPDTPEEIRALQTMLTKKGYEPGPIDGLMGRKTRLAIMRMQQEHGLPITGWLSAETMMVVEDGPKVYSGKPLSAEDREKYADSNSQSSQQQVQARQTTRQSSGPQWYVRGMTSTKAVVYRTDGMSYAVSVGSEIPGMGQVLEINPSENEIRTAHGLINRRR